MAKQDDFQVSRKGAAPVKVTWLKPESIEDPQWEKYGVSREQINDLATQSLVIKIQGNARGELDNGAAAVQKVVDNYKYGQRGPSSGTRSVSLPAEAVKSAGFTAEQIAMLRDAGVSIPGLDVAPAASAESTASKQEGKKAA